MTKLKLRVQAIIFDMDGVITNTMPDHYHSWKAVLETMGIPVNYYDIYSREGQPGIHTIRELSAQRGKAIDDGEARRVLRKKEELFKKIVRLRFIPGARSFIRRLHREQFRLSLVTGTACHEMHRILPESLRKLFSVIITGDDVLHGKPHPEPYLKSLKELKLKAKDAVVIENAPFGIKSAKAAGLRCLALETSLPRKYLREADAVLKSIKELSHKVSLAHV